MVRTKPDPADATAEAAADPSVAEQQAAAEADLGDTASSDIQRAAAKRRTALGADGNPQYVDALLAERRGYVMRGLDARVADVDTELDRHGYAADNA